MLELYQRWSARGSASGMFCFSLSDQFTDLVFSLVVMYVDMIILKGNIFRPYRSFSPKAHFSSR